MSTELVSQTLDVLCHHVGTHGHLLGRKVRLHEVEDVGQGVLRIQHEVCGIAHLVTDKLQRISDTFYFIIDLGSAHLSTIAETVVVAVGIVTADGTVEHLDSLDNLFHGILVTVIHGIHHVEV